MEWFFFILLNGAFFIRPAEVMSGINIPIYNVFMICCLTVSVGRLSRVIHSLSQSPITVCVLGVLAACFLSQSTHGMFGLAVACSVEMAKVVIYYLLVVALIDTRERLRSFLKWVVVFTAVLTLLALLHYHGVIEIDSLRAYQQNDLDPETGQFRVIPRLCGAGVFQDPNDLSMILVLGMIACLLFVEQATSRIGKCLPFAPLALFLYGLQLTYSRGGLLSFGLGMLILFRAKLGWKKTVALSLVLFPVMLALFGGRMTRIDVGNTGDTSQHRIQVWSAGLDMLRESPLFGVGMNNYGPRAGLVAHNSFVHTYGELGFFGGTMFAGAFYAAFTGIRRLGHGETFVSDRAVVTQWKPYLLAMIGAYCMGMYSLSRCYTITTYLLLAICEAYLQIAERLTSTRGMRFDSQFVQRLALVGAACVTALYLFVRLMVRWH